MKKDTFLHRVETIVLYTGQKQWDGALSIRELLETDDLYFKNKEHFLSFKMNIIDACHMAEDEISQYKGDVYVLFKILNDKEHFISDENRKLRIKYKETLYVLAELRKDKRYIEIAEEGFDNDKEENNMCELLDLLENRGEVRGRAQGEKKGIQALIELCQELGLSKTETRIKTESKYNIEQSKLNDYIELYWK